MTDEADRLERASRRRTRGLWAVAIIYVLWQTTFYTYGQGDAAPVRTVDQVRVAAWVVWTGVILMLLATGGGWVHGRELRRRLNDEVSVAHRREGQRYGFWGAMFAGLAVYIVSQFERVGTHDAVHLVMSTGVGVAVLRYALLERRAERAG